MGNLGETGRLRLYRDPPPQRRLALFDTFPPRLRALINAAPIKLSVLYFEKLLLSGMSEDDVCRRCESKCRRIIKQLRKDGVLP